MKKIILSIFIFFCLTVLNLGAQTPGLMVRPPGTAGPLVLDPNGDGYTSATATPQGFTANDIASSEIPYKLIPALAPEPTGDLLRGPDGKFSDIVKTFDGSGFYMFSSTGNLLARLRMGGIVSGSKGYSVMLDTDLKFGPTGPNADPNFQPRTTGTNGNPGFEFEIVYETNFRVAIYNVDGTSTPVLVTSYTIAASSQISVAATRDGGDADYFYDFYVPYAAMGLTGTSPIRAVATTVMCPCPAIGGPKSDIYGVGEGDYMDLWTDIIIGNPPFTPDDLTGPGPGPGPACTKAPVINTTEITPTTTLVSVTWTKSSYSTVTSANVTLYKGNNIIIAGPQNMASGSTFDFTVSGLLANDSIFAKASGTGESTCLASNAVKVNAFNNGTHTPLGAPDAAWPTCASEKGMAGTKLANASVMIYRLASAGYVLFAADVPAAGNIYLVTYSDVNGVPGIGGTRWQYDGGATQSADPCGGGNNDIPQGAYMMVSQLAPNCASVPTPLCAKSGGAAVITPTPVITSLLTDGARTISGTSTGAAVSLFINDYFVQAVTVTGGTFTFTLATPLATGQNIKVYASRDLECLGAPAGGTITCYIAAPVITTDASKRVAIGSQLTGTSAAPLNTTITIYNAVGMGIIGTTTTAANGNWTLTTPTVATGINYLARITGSACGNSALSDTAKATTPTGAKCGSINGPIQETTNAFAVTGTVLAGTLSTTVTLLVDSVAVGSQTITGATTNWSITVPANTLYPGAVVNISVAELNRTAIGCAATQTVTCRPPTPPNVTPIGISNISSGQTVTYTINPSIVGLLYSITNNATSTDMGGSRFGTGGSITITTTPFSTPGTYTLDIKSDSLSGNCQSTTSRQVVVTGVVPVTLTDFTGRYENGIAKLKWETAFEQDIQSYEVERAVTQNQFTKIGSVTAVGNSQVTQNYTYDDAGVKDAVVYYRLKIIDNSTAGFKYSKIITLRTVKGIVLSQVSPNPFTESVLIKFDAAKSANMTLRITDMMGRPVKTQNFISKSGMNSVVTSGLQQLAAGTYIIEISAEGERLFMQQLLKK